MSTKTQPRSLPIEKGSLRDIIASNPRSYYVRVEDWGPQHLEGLNCRVSPIAEHSSTTSAITPIENCSALDQCWLLSLAHTQMKKDSCVRDMFRLLVPAGQPYFEDSSNRIRLHFHRRPITPTLSPLLFRSKSSPQPIFAFIDQTWLSDRRFQIFKNRKACVIHNAVQQRNELDLDPYYAGLLISMAQNGYKFTSSDIIKVHLFAPSKDHKSLIQHTAKIPRQYLQKFDKPRKFFDCGFTITRTRIPFERLDLIVQTLRDIENDVGDTLEAHDIKNDVGNACKDTAETQTHDTDKNAENSSTNAHETQETHDTEEDVENAGKNTRETHDGGMYKDLENAGECTPRTHEMANDVEQACKNISETHNIEEDVENAPENTLESPVSPRKRKQMSDITNNSPDANLNNETKCPRLQEDI